MTLLRVRRPLATLRSGAARGGAVLVLATATTLAPTSAAHAAVGITWKQIGTGLGTAVQVTSARDGVDRLFVVEKDGLIRIVQGDAIRKKPFLDISAKVKTDGEGGLLGVAFHPKFSKHPFFWVTYTNRDGDVQLSRFRARGPHSATAIRGSEKRVLVVAHPHAFTNHMGGGLAFGRDGYLFMSTGDGGGGGDPYDHGQSKSVLQGKLLRLQVIGAKSRCDKYMCVPKSNPYAGDKPGRGAIWLIGLRNAWRFSVDPATGDLWIADVGQDKYEEVDHVTRGGLNLGWSCHEGNSVYNQARCRSGATYTAPTYVYDHDYGSSIIGGFVYRGTNYADLLGGRYIGGDFVSGKVFYGDGDALVTAGSLGNVTSFGEDDHREIWAVTVSGDLFRMAAA